MPGENTTQLLTRLLQYDITDKSYTDLFIDEKTIHIYVNSVNEGHEINIADLANDNNLELLKQLLNKDNRTDVMIAYGGTDFDLNILSEIKNIKKLTIEEAESLNEENLGFIRNLKNLEHVSVNGDIDSKCFEGCDIKHLELMSVKNLDLSVLENVKNLEKLEINYLGLNDFKKYESQVHNLLELEIDVTANGMDYRTIIKHEEEKIEKEEAEELEEAKEIAEHEARKEKIYNTLSEENVLMQAAINIMGKKDYSNAELVLAKELTFSFKLSDKELEILSGLKTIEDVYSAIEQYKDNSDVDLHNVMKVRRSITLGEENSKVSTLAYRAAYGIGDFSKETVTLDEELEDLENILDDNKITTNTKDADVNLDAQQQNNIKKEIEEVNSAIGKVDFGFLTPEKKTEINEAIDQLRQRIGEQSELPNNIVTPFNNVSNEVKGIN